MEPSGMNDILPDSDDPIAASASQLRVMARMLKRAGRNDLAAHCRINELAVEAEGDFQRKDRREPPL